MTVILAISLLRNSKSFSWGLTVQHRTWQ